LCFCYLILLSEKIKHLTKSSTHRPSTQTFLPSLTFSSLKSQTKPPTLTQHQTCTLKNTHKLSLSLSSSLLKPHHKSAFTKKVAARHVDLFPTSLLLLQRISEYLNKKKETYFLIFLFMSTGMEHSLVFMLCFGPGKTILDSSNCS